MRFMRHFFWLFLVLISTSGVAQSRWDAARIQLELEKLGVVGNALYVAAHPDDENTRLITWLANEQKVRTGYLSLTRGDGGQNLIGDEKGPLMGLIRTQELREARHIDGGEQFFTRALDFGYSKSSEETLEKWIQDSVLADVVRIIRQFKPDVIVTRFPPNKYAGHGHHSSSAILAEQAFEIVGDPEKFPESARKFGVWQPKRLVFNDSPWWDSEIEKRQHEYVVVDVGAYNPLLGRSYREVAALSRSQHRSQGFGARQSRGHQLEYLKFKKGNEPSKALFDGIELSWERVEGGKAIGKQIETILQDFEPAHPENSLPALAKLYKAIQTMPDHPWKDYKLRQTRQLMQACGSIWLELLAEQPYVVIGDSMDVTLELVAQAPLEAETDIQMVLAHLPGHKKKETVKLSNNPEEFTFSVLAPSRITQPYWLEHDPEHNMFQIDNRDRIGLPENPAFMQAEVMLNIHGTDVLFEVPLRYKWVDRAVGELYRHVQVVPELTVTPLQKSLVFTDRNPKEVTFKCQTRDRALGAMTVKPVLPEGWSCTPNEVALSALSANALEFVSFQITPPETMNRGQLEMELVATNSSGRAHDLIEIAYPHIETQVVMPPTRVNLVYAPLEKKGQTIGYIMGAGDEVPNALEQLGYEVVLLDVQRATLADLQPLDAVVLGIRAFNKVQELATFHQVLEEYAFQGGHVVVQYNTNRGLVTDAIAPGKIRLSRKRVTVEEAPVSFPNPDHPMLHQPNDLAPEDFEGWVQERGLYFADQWDESFTPLLSWNDPGEDPQQGSLLVRDYGKGSYIYTGISFFRQLPAGVPGAYRLLANILSYRSSAAEEAP
ncbi:MAG: PIG-L family deacetylase [Leptolyngbya sp. SIO3F4]|nr:PIG-L family deacetylase [Leptolyngbya sp. SIO3F4]